MGILKHDNLITVIRYRRPADRRAYQLVPSQPSHPLTTDKEHAIPPVRYLAPLDWLSTVLLYLRPPFTAMHPITKKPALQRLGIRSGEHVFHGEDRVFPGWKRTRGSRKEGDRHSARLGSRGVRTGLDDASIGKDGRGAGHDVEKGRERVVGSRRGERGGCVGFG
jgi:hypothetical protein